LTGVFKRVARKLRESPYWPKWKSFAKAFGTLYQDQAQFTFSESEPWTFFEFAPLKVVVAGLNSTMAESHLETDHYGACGEDQYRWFAQRLEAYKDNGWLRIAAVHHNPHRGAVEDDENLRDVEDLRVRLLDQVNLMLHGHTHNGRWETLQNVPVLATGSAALKQEVRPANEIPNQYQIVRVHRDGFIRYCRAYDPARKKWIGDNRASRDGNTWIDDQRNPFENVDGTFGLPDARAPNERDIEDIRVHDAQPQYNRDDLLARLQKLKALKLPDATNLSITEHQDHTLRYLRASFSRSSLTPMHLVGSCDGEWHPETWQRFLELRQRGEVEVAEFVVGRGSIPDEAWVQAKAQRVEIYTFLQYQGLIDFKSYLERQIQRLDRDERYRTDWYVEQRLEQRNVFGWRNVRNPQGNTGEDWKALDAIEAWMEQPDGVLVLVLAEFGSGKSFMLRQLARRLHNTHITPVFVDLSQLEKGLGFDELIAQHLAREGVLRVDLSAFHDMLEQGRIALLFDGFDELVTRTTYARANVYLDMIINAAQGKARVVLTSRTEHFMNDQQVLQAFGERIKQVTSNKIVRIIRFSDDDILEYLTKRLGDPQRATQRFALIKEVKDLLGLSHNPRMLGFIADLNETELEEARNGNGEITEASLYHKIVDRWLEYEVLRRNVPGAPPPVRKDDLWKVVRRLASAIWEQPNHQIGLEALQGVVRECIQEFTILDLTTDDMTFQTGSGTLLIRDEEGQFSFVHRSILEYLLADTISTELQSGTSPHTLETGKVSELMARFVVTLAGLERVNAWAVFNPHNNDITANNVLELRKRLAAISWTKGSEAVQEMVVQDYSGKNLAGQDFTGQDLRQAQFSNATIPNTSFSDADLREAIFDNADLRRANFSRAKLEGARFRDADLSLTKFVGSSLDSQSLDDAKSTFGVANQVNPQVIRPEWFGICGSITALKWLHPNVCVVGTGTGQIYLIDPFAMSLIRSLEGHATWVGNMGCSQDGKVIVSGSLDGKIYAWETESGSLILDLDAPKGIRTVLCNFDGSLLIAAGVNKKIYVWKTSSGQLESTLIGSKGEITCISISSNQQQIVAGDFEGTVRIWNMRTGEMIKVLDGDRKSIRAIKFYNGRIIAGTEGGLLIIWDTNLSSYWTEV
jgi:Pentapeptide repeats (9 copies)/NACHT domain/WD domain, G-beta repeat